MEVQERGFLEPMLPFIARRFAPRPISPNVLPPLDLVKEPANPRMGMPVTLHRYTIHQTHDVRLGNSTVYIRHDEKVVSGPQEYSAMSEAIRWRKGL